MKDKATKAPYGIKHNPIYKDPNYSTPKIIKDIDNIRTNAIVVFSEKERQSNEELLKDEPLLDVEEMEVNGFNLRSLHDEAASLASKKITPSKPIQDLLDDAVLQAWVKDGIPLHRDNRKTCGFCGQVLPADLWAKLDEHFSKESKDLEASLGSKINDVELEIDRCGNLLKLQKVQFYSSFHYAFETLYGEYAAESKKYVDSLNSVIAALNLRINDIFTPKPISPLMDNVLDLENIISKLNELVSKNNEKTKTLANDQGVARDLLRLNEIAKFISDINFAGEEKDIQACQEEVEKLKEEASEIFTEVQNLDSRISELQMQLRDEKKGAERVNDYLSHFFGHEAIRLEAFEDTVTSAFKFKIMRGDKPAYNLSEGECSLVAFCYFIARLEEADTKGKNPIIYIDDPISSLDSNHIFFIYSLIESQLAAPREDASGSAILDSSGNKTYNYEQLFISTHNLEFLKYLKMLSKPKKNTEQFLLVAKSDGSFIGKMPDYLKNYITEFNYLFGEIYKCTDVANATEEHHCFYSFGNNLRKFLEAFLFFKYPFSEYSQADHNKRIEKFFKDDVGSEPLVQRVINEFSHLIGAFDRSVQPIDCAEISKLACFVLKRIRDNDQPQYECLLQSIGMSDPIVP